VTNFRGDPHTAPDAARAVLLTVDVQADFTRPGAPAEIAGTAEAVPNMARLVQAFRAAGRPIIHLVRLYRADGSNVDLCRRAAVEAGWNVARPEGAGAHIVTELTPAGTQLDTSTLLNGHPQMIGPDEWVAYKPRWGGFYETCLEQMVKWLKANTVVVCGCNFPNCPRTTVYEASERDLRVVLVDDAISGLYDQGRRELEGIGVRVAHTEECLAWIGQGRRVEGAESS